MLDKLYLINNIELLREKLHTYLAYLDLTDAKVVSLSEELDKLIVLYERYELVSPKAV